MSLGEGPISPRIRRQAAAEENAKWMREHGLEVEKAATIDTGVIRKFATGATRDTGADKLDFEGFLSPRVLIAFAQYMHEHRLQTDGSLRDSDNWQKGIPQDVYLKSAFRHFMDFWMAHRGLIPRPRLVAEILPALMFNIMGYLHEELVNNPLWMLAGETPTGTVPETSAASPVRPEVGGPSTRQP